MLRTSLHRVFAPILIGTTSVAGSLRTAYAESRASSTILTPSTKPRRGKLTDVKDRVVLITGASAGIGTACAWRFAEQGSRLVLISRRQERLDALKAELLHAYPSIKVHTVAMSVIDYKAVEKLPNELPADFRNVDILVNNAGLAKGVTPIDANDIEDAQQVMDTNVMGTIAFCRAFTPGMKARGYGHIINMGSVAGFYAYSSGTVYNASKYAIHGFTEAARHDLIATPIRVTHISPGMVSETEFSNVRLGDDKKAAAVYDNIAALIPDDVADNVIYAATRPSNVQIAEIMMYCTNQSAPKEIARLGPSMGTPSSQH